MDMNAIVLTITLIFMISNNDYLTDQGSSSSRPGSGNIPYEDVVVKKVMDLMYQVQGQAVTCIYNIHKHYPVIVGR